MFDSNGACKIIRVRWHAERPPSPLGCRWCGHPPYAHDAASLPHRRDHLWEQPTPTTHQHEIAEHTISQALHILTLRFTSWHLWYGKATGRYWALSPTWCREHIGLIEADTPAELAAQLQNIENYHPGPDQPESSGEDNKVTHEGGDRDGNTTVVRTRWRTR